MRLAQAALRISDLWFIFRIRSVESIADEVVDFLTERQLPFDRGEKRAGRSGRSWTVDFHVRPPERSSLVYVLSTGNRSAARTVAEYVLAAWYDLNHLAAGPEALWFVSLFDDTIDVWNSEDFRLVESLSAVARWSQPEEFAESPNCSMIRMTHSHEIDYRMDGDNLGPVIGCAKVSKSCRSCDADADGAPLASDEQSALRQRVRRDFTR